MELKNKDKLIIFESSIKKKPEHKCPGFFSIKKNLILIIEGLISY